MSREIAAVNASCAALKSLLARVGSAADKQEALDDAAQIMLKLRRETRAAHDAAHTAMTQAENAMLATDSVFLRLQNLRYEKNHLSKEIQLCEDFTPRVVTGLVDDATVQKHLEKSGSSAQPGSHEFELARLAVEMDERKRLISSVRQRELRRKVFENSITSRRSALSGLSGHVDKIQQAIKPVQEFLKESIGTSIGVIRHADLEHLPSPLYTLFYQAVSHQEAFKLELKATVEGDFDAAARLAQGLAVEEEATHRRSKRSKNDDSHPTAQSAQSAAMIRHPLRVSVFVRMPNTADKAGGAAATTTANEGITLHFHWLPRLGVVAVTHSLNLASSSAAAVIQEAQALNILTDLVPGDTGETSPNPANALTAGHDLKLTATTGRAYLWAQAVCGLNFLPPPSSSSSSSSSNVDGNGGEGDKKDTDDDAEMKDVEGGGGGGGGERGKSKAGIAAALVAGSEEGATDRTIFQATVNRIGDRLVTAVAVASQIAALSKLSLPALPGPPTLMPPGCVIQEWKEVENGARRVFHFAVKQDAWILSGSVDISPGYPNPPPLFHHLVISHPSTAASGPLPLPTSDKVLQAMTAKAATDNFIRTVLDEVNYWCPTETAELDAATDDKDAPPPQSFLNLVLCFQFRKLIQCLGLYVDAKGSSSVMPFSRRHRGRDRRLPLVFDETSKTFDQRR